MSNVFDQFDQNVFDQFVDESSRDFGQIRQELEQARSVGDWDKFGELNREYRALELASGGSDFEAIVEPVATIASSIVAEPVAGIAGLAQVANPFAKSGAAAEAVESTREALTYLPKTQRGQENLQAVGDALAPVGELVGKAESTMGDWVMEKTGSPALATAAYSTPTAILEALGVGAIKKGTAGLKAINQSRKAKAVTKAATKAEKIRKAIGQKAANAAIDKGFDKIVVSMIMDSSLSDTAKMNKMVNVLEKGFKNPKYKAINRASDVIGESILARFNVVKSANIRAGKQLDGIAKSLKGKTVDVSGPVDQFMSGLKDMGIDIDPKTIRLGYQNSDIEGLDDIQRMVNRLVNRLKRTRVPDAYDVHRMKKFIDEQVNYGKNAKGLGGKVEVLTKQLRKSLDSVLDSNFPEYDRVNQVYSGTIDAINDLQSIAGKKTNLMGENAKAKIGTLSRRVLSNAQSRVDVINTFKKLQDAAAKNGVRFKDDIVSQVVFLDELEKVFGTSATTSLLGQSQRAVGAALETAAPVVGRALAKGVEKLTKSEEKIIAEKIQAIRELLKRGGKKTPPSREIAAAN